MTETPGRGDREDPRAAVRARFGRVAEDPSSENRFPVGVESARRLGYPEARIRDLPAALAERFAGAGCPFHLGPVPPGGTVLDLGCGAGMDAVLAAAEAGPEGRVVGIDLTESMVRKAREFRDLLGLGNLAFLRADLAAVPLRDGCVDLAISNGALNLCPEKEEAIAEVARVLRPGGRFYLVDVVLEEGVDRATVEKVGAWSD